MMCNSSTQNSVTAMRETIYNHRESFAADSLQKQRAVANHSMTIVAAAAGLEREFKISQCSRDRSWEA